MNRIELKQQLLQRLFVLDDERQLEAIEAFMNKQCPDDALCFSSELRAKVDAALTELQQGKTFTTEEADQRLSRWSGR